VLGYNTIENSEESSQHHGTDIDTIAVRNKRSVWTVPLSPYKDAHFATYPPDLVRPAIRAGSRLGGVVLDPFFGSGTTGLVAIEEGRQYIGIEINPEYCELAQGRINHTLRIPGKKDKVGLLHDLSLEV
jgi:site-specific DNA-methyltransferase (adenine-specific)